MAKDNVIEVTSLPGGLRVRLNGEDVTSVTRVSESLRADGTRLVQLEMVGRVDELTWLPDAEEELPF